MSVSYNEALSIIKGFIRAKYKEFNTLGVGTGFDDAIINTLAHLYKLQKDYIDLVKLLQYLDEAAILPEADIDDLASNFLLTRKEAGKSNGEAVFYTYTFGSDITIPAGTSIYAKSKDGDLVFEVVDTEVFQVSEAIKYYNYVDNRYEFSVNIDASESGEIYNVGAYTILYMLDTVSQISGVVNKGEVLGGTNAETNAELIERIKIKLRGTSRGLEEYYLSKIRESYNPEDIKVIGVGDPVMARDFLVGGKVDVYVKDEEDLVEVVSEEIPQSKHVLDKTILLLNQPVKEIISITPSANIIGVLDIKYKWYAESVYAESGIKITTALPGESIFVTYRYNKKIVDLQKLFTIYKDIGEQDRVVGIDVLVKSGEEVGVEIETYIKLYEEFDFTEVRTSIINDLTNYFNSLGYGEDIEQADILYIIKNVEGVDNVIIPLSKLCEFGKTGVGDIKIGKYQYPVLQVLTIREFV